MKKKYKARPIEKDLHCRIKVLAAQKRLTMNELIEKMVMDAEKIPAPA